MNLAHQTSRRIRPITQPSKSGVVAYERALIWSEFVTLRWVPVARACAPFNVSNGQHEFMVPSVNIGEWEDLVLCSELCSAAGNHQADGES